MEHRPIKTGAVGRDPLWAVRGVSVYSSSCAATGRKPEAFRFRHAGDNLWVKATPGQ